MCVQSEWRIHSKNFYILASNYSDFLVHCNLELNCINWLFLKYPSYCSILIPVGITLSLHICTTFTSGQNIWLWSRLFHHLYSEVKIHLIMFFSLKQHTDLHISEEIRVVVRYHQDFLIWTYIYTFSLCYTYYNWIYVIGEKCVITVEWGQFCWSGRIVFSFSIIG